MKPVHLIGILFMAITWGLSFIYAEILLEYWPDEIIVFMRVAIASLFLLPILLMRKGKSKIPHDYQTWLVVIFLGFINSALPYSLITLGQDLGLEAGLSSILNSTVPIFTAIIGFMFIKSEKLNRYEIGSVLLGMFGVIIIFLPGLIVRGADVINLGILLSLVASISYAVSTFVVKNYAKKMDSIVLVFWSIFFSAIYLLIYSFIFNGWFTTDFSDNLLNNLIIISVFGIFSTSLAYIVLYKLIEVMKHVTNVVYAVMIAPLVTILVSTFLGRNTLDVYSYIGMVFILLGLLIFNAKLFKKRAN